MSHNASNPSRRQFLQQASSLSMLGASAPLAMSLAAAGSVSAAGATDYKALVCVYLHGGNDAFNTVLATDDTSWEHYTAVREQRPESIALLRNSEPDKTKAAGSPEWLGSVLPIAPATPQSSRSFALHPMLTDLQRLFSNKRMAIVPNVGTLIEPLTKADYTKELKQRPRKLFSHSDQQSTWQALIPQGATSGWGGRMADALASSNGNSLFTAISTDGNCVWTAGKSVRTFQVSGNGPITLGPAADAQGVVKVFASDAVGAALARVVSASRNGHLMSSDLGDIGLRSIQAQRVLLGALPATSTAPLGPDTWMQYTNLGGTVTVNMLAKQLQQVARIIAAQRTLGMKRQVFFVGVGGFDTHFGQNRLHADLMLKLNHGLAYFDSVLDALGMASQVTTFTSSEFGRSFTSNGDGSDHGWGAHHLVMGGAVKGGDIVGDFPYLGKKNSANNEFDDSPDQILNGALLPKISVDQYAATLGRWFGLSEGQLTDIFPNLGRFARDPRLDFMRA